MATHFFGATAVLTGRTMRHVTRSLDTIITTAITPIAIMGFRSGAGVLTIGQMLEADAPAFAEAAQRIDCHLRDEVERLETSRKQIAAR